MKNKGRRLRRYLGLRREKLGSLHSGGIEHVLPGRLSGWVVARGIPLHDVRLLVGSQLLAWTEIHQARPDVCAALGWQGQPGFTLVLPAELPALPEGAQPRLLAVSVDGSQQMELQLMRQPERTTELLQRLLHSELLGLDGHCDGIRQGALRGWAGRRGQKQPVQIWLQAAGIDPLSVPCDQWREGMQAMGLPERSGFSVDPWHLPAAWGGREVWCSFDREGQFRLPQVQTVVLPERPTPVPAQAIATPAAPHPRPGAVHPAAAQVVPAAASAGGVVPPREEAKFRPGPAPSGAPEDLRQHWQALEDFRHYLDKLEQELDRRDHSSQGNLSPAARKPWWNRLLTAGL